MRVNYCTENGMYILQLGAVNLNVDITKCYLAPKL